MVTNKMKSVVFMGSKEIGFECLAHLLERQKDLNVRVIAVLTNRRKLFASDKDVQKLAEENDIPILNSLEEYLKLDNFDILISVQYHKVLKKEHIQKADQIAVNLHMAPLPEYRGCNQFSFAILDEAKIFGTTIHKLEEKVDAGPILFEKRFPIPENVWVKDLYQKTFDKSLELFKDSLPKIVNEDYNLIPQEQLTEERGVSYHYRSEMEQIKSIDLDWDREKIERHIRATYFPPFEPPFAVKDGEKVTLDPEWLKKHGNE